MRSAPKVPEKAGTPEAHDAPDARSPLEARGLLEADGARGVDTRLDADERAALERALATDPALAERARLVRAVFDATSVLDEGLPTCRTSFEALLERHDREQRSRWIRRAAAALVVFVPTAWWAWCAWRGSETSATRANVVELDCLPLAPEPSPVPPRVPALLADYSPGRDASIRFLDSLDDARAVAAAVGRPVLVFGYVAGCPWCRDLRANQFQDARFQELASRAVPVAIDLLALDDAVSAPLFERGYPVIELQDARGAPEAVLSGPPGTVDLVRGLASAFERAPTEPPALAWATANDLARKLVTSSSAERQGRFSIAWNGFDELARLDGAFTLGANGRAGLARLANDAGERLAEALERSHDDVAGACAELDALATRCANTPAEEDVRRVLDALRATRAAPRLRERGE